jgi:hypothetical protein
VGQPSPAFKIAGRGITEEVYIIEIFKAKTTLLLLFL